MTQATAYKRLKELPHPRWMGKVSGALQSRIRQHVDAEAESAVAIHRRWNLVRFVPLRTFQWYVSKRRAAVSQYRRESVEETGKPIWEPQTWGDRE